MGPKKSMHVSPSSIYNKLHLTQIERTQFQNPIIIHNFIFHVIAFYSYGGLPLYAMRKMCAFFNCGEKMPHFLRFQGNFEKISKILLVI